MGISERFGLGSKPFNGVISETGWNLCYIFIAHNVLYYIIIIQTLVKHTNKQNKQTNKKQEKTSTDLFSTRVVNCLFVSHAGADLRLRLMQIMRRRKSI